MNGKKLLFCLLALMTCLNLQAYDCEPDNCCTTCCDGEDSWSFSADWLYWKTRKCDLDYLWPSDVTRYESSGGGQTKVDGQVVTLGKGSPKEVVPHYDQGFRLEAGKECGDWKMSLRYTYFKADESDDHTVSNPPYTPSRMHPDIKGFVDRTNITYGKSKYDLDLDTFDLEGGRTWEYDCDKSFSLFGGFQLAFIDQELDTTYKGLSKKTTNEGVAVAPEVRFHTIKEKVDMDAYGVYIGSEGHWDFCKGFGIFARASAGLLLADFDQSFKESEFTDPAVATPVFARQNLVDVKHDHHCFVNHCDFALGLEYSCDSRCGLWAFQLGYEFHQWANMKDFLQFVDHHEKGAVARNTSTLGFDGLFVRFNVVY